MGRCSISNNMSAEARELNARYLNEMYSAAADSTLARIRDLWWKPFQGRLKRVGAKSTMDALDKCMALSRRGLRTLAVKYAEKKGAHSGTEKHTQLVNHFLKSNTGKMFERFVGLTLAEVLSSADSDYCILPFRADTIQKCHNISREDFRITLPLGDEILATHIDADLIAFNPTLTSANIYLISVKSTLRDRFHNVPFWNLLRKVAVGGDEPTIKADNRNLLRKVKYIAICSDLAEEQPDFGSDTGPRELLKIDAALLDGAYVTASRARGLGDRVCMGPKRTAAFCKLSSFLSVLNK